MDSFGFNGWNFNQTYNFPKWKIQRIPKAPPDDFSITATEHLAAGGAFPPGDTSCRSSNRLWRRLMPKMPPGWAHQHLSTSINVYQHLSASIKQHSTSFNIIQHLSASTNIIQHQHHSRSININIDRKLGSPTSRRCLELPKCSRCTSRDGSLIRQVAPIAFQV